MVKTSMYFITKKAVLNSSVIKRVLCFSGSSIHFNKAFYNKNVTQLKRKTTLIKLCRTTFKFPSTNMNQ